MKKILIFTASFGEGHNTAARNIEAGLVEASRGKAEVRVIDIFKESNPRSSAFWARRYIEAINSAPWLWNFAYQIIDRTTFVQDHLWFFGQAIRALDEIFHREQPDIACSTHPLYPYLFQKMARRSEGKAFKDVCVVTDSISINSIWYRAPSDYFIVPNYDSAQVMLEAKTPLEKILPLGFPVQLAFVKNCAPELSDVSAPSILFAVNSNKKDAPEILKGLFAHPTWRVTVVAGRDEELRRKLEPIMEKEKSRAVLLGWTDQMPRLLMSHHVVISKAGGAMVQEAIAARCPMIVNHVVPGQEEGNCTLLVKNNCGALAGTPEKIVPLIESAFAHDGAIWKGWKGNLQKLSTPDSSLKIADFLLNQI